MTPHEERFLDMCLEEVLADLDPPDLCEKILHTIHRESRGPADEDDQPLAHSASEEELTPTTATPAAAGPGLRTPPWARAGKLPRWRRARNLIVVTRGVGAVAAATSLTYHETTERLREEYAQGERASLLALGRQALRRAEDRLIAGDGALAAGRAPDALEAAGRAQAALEGLKNPLANPAVAPHLREEYDRLYTRSLVLRGRATTREGTKAAIVRAGALFEKALASVPEKNDTRRVRVLVALGEMLTAVGRLPDAINSFETALALSPEDWRARLARGRAQALQEDFDEATHDFTRALASLEADAPLEDDPTPREVQIADVLLERSAAYRERGVLDKAMADASRAQELSATVPGNPGWRASTWRARVRQAEVHVQRGERYSAIDLYREAVGRSSGNAALLLAVAEGFLVLGESEGAAEASDEALALEPASPFALVLRAEAAELDCDLDLARDHADGALLLVGPLDWRVAARANRILARFAAINGDTKKAHERVQAAWSVDPYDSDNLILRARIELDAWVEGQNLESAEQAFEQVIRRRGRSVPALRGLARVLLIEHPQQPERAKRRVEEALSVDPTHPASLAVLAQYYLAAAKKTTPPTASMEKLAARAMGQSARAARDPRRPGGQAYSIALRAERRARSQRGGERAKTLERARLAYRQAAWLNPFHAQARTALGRMALAQKSFARARRHVDAALAARPDSMAARFLDARLQTADPDSDLVVAKTSVKTALEGFLRFQPRSQPYQAGLDLLAMQLGLEASERVNRGEVEKSLERTREGFLILRSQAHDAVPLIRRELTLLGRLFDACSDAKGRALITARRKKVQGDLVDLEEERRELSARAKAEYRKALEVLREGTSKPKPPTGGMTKEDPPPLMLDSGRKQWGDLSLIGTDPLRRGTIHARRAVIGAPHDGRALALLAELHAAAGKPWSALACEIQHAYYNRLSRVDTLVDLLIALGRTELTAGVDVGPDTGPLPADLKTLLKVARVVARSRKIEQAEAKEAFAILERVIEYEPSHPLPHLLAGYLAAGVQRNDYAAQELLFVSSVYPESARVLYLVGLTLARGPADAREDALAIRCLRRALDAGFSWPRRPEDERDRARLRASPLWRHLVKK